MFSKDLSHEVLLCLFKGTVDVSTPTVTTFRCYFDSYHYRATLMTIQAIVQQTSTIINIGITITHFIIVSPLIESHYTTLGSKDKLVYYHCNNPRHY